MRGTRLTGQKEVIVDPDHTPLGQLNKEELVGQLRHSKWACAFLCESSNTDVVVEHRSGKIEMMQLADALSRHPDLREDEVSESCHGVLEDTAAHYFH